MSPKRTDIISRGFSTIVFHHLKTRVQSGGRNRDGESTEPKVGLGKKGIGEDSVCRRTGPPTPIYNGPPTVTNHTAWRCGIFFTQISKTYRIPMRYVRTQIFNILKTTAYPCGGFRITSTQPDYRITDSVLT